VWPTLKGLGRTFGFARCGRSCRLGSTWPLKIQRGADVPTTAEAEARASGAQLQARATWVVSLGLSDSRMNRPGGRPTWRLKAVLKVLAEP